MDFGQRLGAIGHAREQQYRAWEAAQGPAGHVGVPLGPPPPPNSVRLPDETGDEELFAGILLARAAARR